MTEEPYLDPKRYVTWRALGTIIAVLWAVSLGLECLAWQTQGDLEAKFGDLEAAIEAAKAKNQAAKENEEAERQADEQRSDEEAAAGQADKDAE